MIIPFVNVFEDKLLGSSFISLGQCLVSLISFSSAIIKKPSVGSNLIKSLIKYNYENFMIYATNIVDSYNGTYFITDDIKIYLVMT